MNFEVFKTQEELDARIVELIGQTTEVITDFNGSVFTLKWR